MKNELPRREQSPEEIALLEQHKEAQKHENEKENAKIRCPCCKKNQYFDQYFSNRQLGVLTCPKCGILFIDQEKLKIIKKNISEAKAKQIFKPR